MSDDPYRHPGGRTCAGAVLALTTLAIGAAGLLAGMLWGALHILP